MTDDEFRQYIKSIGSGAWNNPVIDLAVINEYDADPVFEGPQATGGTVYQFSMRDGVEEIDGQWYTKYILGPVFTNAEDEAAYKAQKDAEQAERIRADRNKRLTDCDWTQLADAQVDKAIWATYRQALRDLPKETDFPWAMTWPTSP
jgi:hypothetical protein